MRLQLHASIATSGVALVAAGCGARFPLPMTANELVQYGSGPALVAYLGQPDASPTVCDLHARGPHVRVFTPDLRAALVNGLVDGSIAPGLWRRCTDAALASLHPEQVPWMFDDVMHAYFTMLKDADLQTDPALAERVASVQRLYLERRPGQDGHANILVPVFDELRSALAGKQLAPVARSFAQDLIASIDVEHGTWQGHPVDVAMMDALAAAGNEMTLRRFAERLPRADLRQEASRRIIRIHVALSAFDEVRGAAAAVEESVLRDGHNRIVLGEHPLVRAWFDERNATIRNVLVRQEVWNQTATLLGYSQERPTLSVLPELSFRGHFWAELEAISRPVTLCSAKPALDPTPCIGVLDVSLDNPFTYLDKGSAFHFRDNVREHEIAPWAARASFTLPVGLAGRPAVSLRWGLTYERPDNLDFAGQDRGPDLDVRVDHPMANRYVFTVNSPQGGYVAVVEDADLGNFHVASRGARGASGSDGRAGSDGLAGAACSNGGAGSNGSNGGDGHPGGDGGNIRVVIACGTGPCDVDQIEGIIFSTGGDGGAGGSGGAGGDGGAAGAARSPTTHVDSHGDTIVDDPGCDAGLAGSSGSKGSDGSRGRPGNPGHISFSVVR